jgi:hypothetical protein
MRRESMHELRSALRAPYALLAMFGVLFAVAATTESAALMVASLVFLVGTPVLSAWVNLRLMVRGELVVADGVPDRFVVLRNVHPAFAAAVRRAYDERTARAASLPLAPSIYALNVGPPQIG